MPKLVSAAHDSIAPINSSGPHDPPELCRHPRLADSTGATLSAAAACAASDPTSSPTRPVLESLNPSHRSALVRDEHFGSYSDGPRMRG